MAPALNLRQDEWPELYIRVAYRIIEQNWRAAPYDKDGLVPRFQELVTYYGYFYNSKMELALAAYGFHIQRGLYSKFIRTTMVERARMGCTFREVLLWSYKAGRRRDPRIT